jgi:plasmid stabilization system protein ParE
MRYTVVWTNFALARLTDLWLQTADRNAVTAAQHQIDQLLRVDPELQGVPFFGDRLLVVPPLRVVFAVNPMDMIVEVFDVW